MQNDLHLDTATIAELRNKGDHLVSTSKAALSMKQVLIFWGLMVTMSMGIRHGFGLFNLPITMANGWGRETFALTIALQNLIWGAVQPITGALADRYGAFKIMIAGGVLYALGLAGMAVSSDVLNFTIAGGLLIGLAQTATTYNVVYGILGRNVPADKRVLAMGIAAAAGSFGQFLMIPAEQGLLSAFGAQDALLMLALMASLMIPTAFMLREKNLVRNHALGDQTIKEALKEAITNPSFRLLMLGYLFDRTGSYLVVWQIAIALGVFAFLVNSPIKELPITRVANA